MPVPARRHSRSRPRRRRSHDALKPINVGLCVACQAPLLPHTACKNCGTYKGKQVVDTSREVKREAKKVAAPPHDHGHEAEAKGPKDKKAS